MKSGGRIKTHLLIWTGGVAPSPAVKNLDCQRSLRGGLVTDACFRIAGCTGVWAIGDCADVPQPGKQQPYAPTAQNATREGEMLARNVVAMLRGEEPQPFVYRPIGELAIIGKRTGVASIYGLRFSGKLAWFMWRSIYLLKMPRLSMRLRVAVDWTCDLLFGREIAELPAQPAASAAPQQPAPDQPARQEQTIV
jgi:NADH:ubiquinone reductase (H+-translocating)